MNGSDDDDVFARMADEIIASGHQHLCKYGADRCEGMFNPEGSCACECGAVLEERPTYKQDGRWAWHLPDGTWSPWPGGE